MFALRRKPDGKSCDLSEATQGNRWMKAAWWPVVMECGRPSAGNVNTTHSPEKKKKTAASRQCITAGMVCQRPRGLSSPVDDNLCGWGNLPVRRQPSAPGRAVARLTSTSTSEIAVKRICRKPAAQFWDATSERPNIIHPEWWRPTLVQPYICIYSLVSEVK